ncbi:uncharacterized protein UV8b_06047 [Ustilaginoidea virens]|uniref:Uncharacterized protein n=1 Tax=Ustilaginoidea virens TaxID=1159556 RepID=A0A8E5HUJ5_USTVR|nr:uncharacterized protein UV8b_06047 [Ustilaginoidea virens]QUC21806.1 hypothetical protein UV8b_06047 [Ustilaginoidea virens]
MVYIPPCREPGCLLSAPPQNTIPGSPYVTKEMAISFIFAAIALAHSAQSTAQCYWMNGTEATKDMQPCNPNQAVSACCASNKARPDICTTRGICISQDEGYTGLAFANGCTDPTGKDRNCPQICVGKLDSSIFSINVLACNSGGHYCCRDANDHKNCCDNALAQVEVDLGGLFIPEPKTVTTAPSGTAATTPTAAACESNVTLNNNLTGNASCPTDKAAVVGGAVGGVLGGALLAALGAIAVMHRQRSRNGERGPNGTNTSKNCSPDYHFNEYSNVPQELPALRSAHELRG